MTFTELRTEIMDRLNLTSSAASTRVGRAINRVYRKVTSSIGLELSRRVTIQQAVSIGVSTVTFTNTEKVINVYNRSVSPYKLLDLVTIDELEGLQPFVAGGNPTKYALSSQTSDTVTVLINCIPQTAFVLYADVHTAVADLSGTQEPAFPESFHDVIIEGVLADELRKMEKPQLAGMAKVEYDRILSDLRMWIAKTGYLDNYQGKSAVKSTGFGTGSGGGSGSINGALSWTQTGLITFNRPAAAPFAVVAGSLKVANLDADLLDGIDWASWAFNVKSYGATGDGVTNDTVAITAANVAASAAGQPLYFPKGTYLTTIQTFIPATRTRWIGAGSGLTTLKVTGGTGTAITATWTHLRSEWYSEISGMTIDGNAGTGPLINLNGGTLIRMRDLMITNVVGTGLKLVSIFDSHFENVYVEVCGDATHPCVLLDSNAPIDDGLNNCQFYNLHIEPGPVDAVLLDIQGNANSPATVNKFYGLKVHGDSATSLPNRPVLRLGAYANQNHFYDTIVAFGKSTSQVEITGNFNHFYSVDLGVGTVPPQCAFDLFGGGNRIQNAILPTTYTTTYFRNAGNENVVLYPRMAAGGPTVFTGAGQFHIEYRNPANSYETSFATIGQKIDSLVDFSSRVALAKGATVAAANDLSLGFAGNLFHISGATQINAIATAYWQAGSEITLIFDSTPIVKHNTAGGAGTAVLLLASGADFTAAANDTLVLVYDGTSWYEKRRFDNAFLCEGRLTLTTAVPVTTADVTGAATVYFTPYTGNKISLYSGTRWSTYTFTERSLALGTITNDLPYDVFIYDNAGTVTLELLAWTNKTTRATALVLQDGVLSKTGALTRRYLGTFHTTATTTTEDSYAKRLLWNYYNRVSRPLAIFDTTDSWTYDTAAFRQVRATATNQIVVVVGWVEDAVELHAGHAATHSSAGTVITAVGYDSTTVPITPTAGQILIPNTASATSFAHVSAVVRHFPAVGFHTYAWLERAASATTTWYGDGGSVFQTGMVGSIKG